MDKVYGPYLRKDGRKHVIIKTGTEVRTVSYPKYLFESYYGVVLNGDETIDHANGDAFDDRIENLQILSRANNARKYFEDHPEKKAKKVTLTCSYCGRYFIRVVSVLKRGESKNKNKDFFCSRRCQGKVYH